MISAAGYSRWGKLTTKLSDVSPILRPPPAPEVLAFNSLVTRIREFEANLAETETVGAMLASFGSSVHLQLRTISRQGQFVCLEGTTEDGGEATLVQHYTQVSVLLVKVTVAEPAQKRPIGFSSE
ncbi:DUF6173 family protein [Cupriavidus sp. YR651]|uniref:DUF6173 family protein n=1 Tax=Cupriavidus sp. YR651 TaxID=1855315 RepID=UPI00115FC5B8|nr:DUF6173 family protein [Cupriavidus sp. YR651]